MTSRLIWAVAALAAAALAQPALAHNNVGNAIAAGIVGAAIGAALSESGRHDSVIYNGDGGHHRTGRFSPSPGVECYDASQSCYYDAGGYSGKWTGRVYGN